MHSRKPNTLTAVAMLLCATSGALGADAKYFAQLGGAGVEPRAEGRAVWMDTGNEVHFSVRLQRCPDHDVVLVVVGDWQFAERMRVIDGQGALHLVLQPGPDEIGEFPHVTQGTPIRVFDGEGTLILDGRFERLASGRPVHRARGQESPVKP